MMLSCGFDKRGGCALRAGLLLVKLCYATHIAMHWFCSKHPKKGHFEKHRCACAQHTQLALIQRTRIEAEPR